MESICSAFFMNLFALSNLNSTREERSSFVNPISLSLPFLHSCKMVLSYIFAIPWQNT